MPLRIRIGNPLDTKALGKNLRILSDGTVATSSGEPVGDPNLPTSRMSQASLVDIGGRTGLNLGSESGFDLTPGQEPADPKNTFLVLHAEGDTQEQMLAKLSAEGGLEIRRGFVGGASGGTEAIIPAYPFCQGYGYGYGYETARVPTPYVIPSTFKSRPRISYLLLNEGTYVDATFLARLSVPEQYLIESGQLEPLVGDGYPYFDTPPEVSMGMHHPVRGLAEDHERYRFFSHPYYAGAAIPFGAPASTGELYSLLERQTSYTLAWMLYSDEGGEPSSETMQHPVQEVMNLGGAPHYLMMFRSIPGGEPLVWDIHWVDGGPLISRFQGVTSNAEPLAHFMRDYPIWPDASLTDGVTDHDKGAYFWGYAPALSLNTKREVRISAEQGSRDQFHQVAITMRVAGEMGGEELG